MISTRLEERLPCPPQQPCCDIEQLGGNNQQGTLTWLSNPDVTGRARSHGWGYAGPRVTALHPTRAIPMPAPTVNKGPQLHHTDGASISNYRLAASADCAV